MNERYRLLPFWIKFFSWLFLITLISPIVFIIGYNQGDMEIGLWGIDYYGSPYHPIAIVLLALMAFHGVAAIGLIRGARWGLDSAITCGIIGGLCSIIGMILNSLQGISGFEFSLIVQVFFVVTLFRIRSDWLSIKC